MTVLTYSNGDFSATMDDGQTWHLQSGSTLQLKRLQVKWAQCELDSWGEFGPAEVLGQEIDRGKFPGRLEKSSPRAGQKNDRALDFR